MRSSLVRLTALVLLVGAVLGASRLGPAGAQDATPDASPAADCPTTTEEENEAIARRWHEEAINQHDPDLLDAILAEDVVHHAATFPDASGPEAVKAVHEALLTGFPDLLHTLEAVISDGDLVVTRWVARGTHRGEFQGIAPTGKQVTYTGTNIYRIECGRIAESWSENDLLQQLRALPAGATPDAGTPIAEATATR